MTATSSGTSPGTSPGPSPDTSPAVSYRSPLLVGGDRFSHLLRSELTKFRTVRGWVLGMVLAAVVTVALGLLTVAGSHSSCNGGAAACAPPIGPEGQAVVDNFTFVHQQLDGDGSITARVASFEAPEGGIAEGELEPWAKAGLIVKDGLGQGTSYAAVMLTGSEGVRMQHDFVHDTAGLPGAIATSGPRWLRLTRTGDSLTGSESFDGVRWTHVDIAQLDNLSPTVQVGLFVTSPEHEETTQGLGTLDSIGEPTQATASFDEVDLQSTQPLGQWIADEVRGDLGGVSDADETFQLDGSTFVLTGSGDIAPAIARSGDNTVEQSLVGAFAGLIVVIVLGTMFMTSEYRRGLIRTTFAASPRRARVLAAKAVVLGGITFVTGLIASALAFQIVEQMRTSAGDSVLPVSGWTELRVVAGTAALLATAAVFALAVGAVMRRSVGAVATVIVLVVLPYILAVASFLPVSTAQWLLRVTPASAFAIQQSTQQYAQVSTAYTPATGYYPLSPVAGFAVLCAWTAVALGLAVVLIRRRDA